MYKLSINTHPTYSIYMAENLLTDVKLIQLCQSLAPRWVVVSDSHVALHYADLVVDALRGSVACRLLTVPAGEASKSRDTKAALEEQMFSLGYGRDSGMIALGGGVVMDLVGFVAATYCRGIAVIYMPTSLLAMVDASIGGKTAINVDVGKNLIGVIRQPNAVFIDPNTLQTLTHLHYIDGLIETLKHALIADAKFWYHLIAQQAVLLSEGHVISTEIIYRSMRIKAQIVEQDVTEQGMRMLLNFGHSIAHALEAVSHYQLSHGQAVLYGMITESYMSCCMGYLPKHVLAHIIAVLRCYIITPLSNFEFNQEQLLSLLKRDKKSCQQSPRFVLLQDVAKPYVKDECYAHEVVPALLADSLSYLLNFS